MRKNVICKVCLQLLLLQLELLAYQPCVSLKILHSSQIISFQNFEILKTCTLSDNFQFWSIFQNTNQHSFVSRTITQQLQNGLS